MTIVGYVLFVPPFSLCFLPFLSPSYRFLLPLPDPWWKCRILLNLSPIYHSTTWIIHEGGAPVARTILLYDEVITILFWYETKSFGRIRLNQKTTEQVHFISASNNITKHDYDVSQHFATFILEAYFKISLMNFYHKKSIKSAYNYLAHFFEKMMISMIYKSTE